MTITFIETATDIVQADQVNKPQDRIFRNAWQLNGAVIDIDMDQAREIWREKIRQARKPELERLDADYMKALEMGDTTLQQSISSQKQALRDATQDTAIEAAQTPEELTDVQPAGLTVS